MLEILKSRPRMPALDASPYIHAQLLWHSYKIEVERHRKVWRWKLVALVSSRLLQSRSAKSPTPLWNSELCAPDMLTTTLE